MEKFMVCFGSIPFLHFKEKADKGRVQKVAGVAYLKNIIGFLQAGRNPLLDINRSPDKC